jgi:DNA polymerase III epsilon subunit-like protein
MAGTLAEDPQFQSVTFHIIDFETTTPRGFRPEPIEVAVISLSARTGQLTETARHTALMKPPPHAPVTRFDSDQTGITPEMTDGQPPAAEVLAKLDAELQPQQPAVLVAHSAPVEGSLLYDYREHCPGLARTHLLDTVRLARTVYPGLPSYGLDALMAALDIPRPADRHRALADTEVTAVLFRRLLADAAGKGLWASLRDLRKSGGYDARAAAPSQLTLFT